MKAKVILLIIAMPLAGCRHAPPPDTGRSSFAIIEPRVAPPPKSSNAEVKEPTNSLQYSEAVPIPPLIMPVYPRRALAAKAGWATVGVKITVDSTGRVTDIRPSILTLSTPGPFAADFREAVELALRQWKFYPAENRKVKYVEADGTLFGLVTHADKVETEFDLSFTFTATGRVDLLTPGK